MNDKTKYYLSENDEIAMIWKAKGHGYNFFIRNQQARRVGRGNCKSIEACKQALQEFANSWSPLYLEIRHTFHDSLGSRAKIRTFKGGMSLLEVKSPEKFVTTYKLLPSLDEALFRIKCDSSDWKPARKMSILETI